MGGEEGKGERESEGESNQEVEVKVRRRRQSRDGQVKKVTLGAEGQKPRGQIEIFF